MLSRSVVPNKLFVLPFHLAEELPHFQLLWVVIGGETFYNPQPRSVLGSRQWQALSFPDVQPLFRQTRGEGRGDFVRP